MKPQQLLTARILWGALLASNLAYVVILQVLRSGSSMPPPTPIVTLLPMLALLGVVNLAMSFALPRVFYARAASAYRPAVREDVAADPLGARGFRTAAASERVFAEPEAARQQALAVFMTPFILGMALAESVSIFGLVLGFLGGHYREVLPFFALGVLAQVVRFPTAEGVEGSFARAHGARFPEAPR